MPMTFLLVQVHCPEIHGNSGLDARDGGHALPATEMEVASNKGVIFMHDTICSCYSNNGEKVAIIATGALTNVALLLILYPEISDMIDIVFMGGVLGIGNTGPVVEFNVQIDPEACKVVLDSGCEVVMVPLEVTHTALVTQQVLDTIEEVGAKDISDVIKELVLYFSKTYQDVFNFSDPPLHDPCAVAYASNPEIFKVEKMRVDVELCSPLSTGQTVVDVWNQSKLEKNVFVAQTMDVPKFWDLLLAAIKAVPSHRKKD